MTAEMVSAIIEDEIAGEWSLTNWHSCDLHKCLVEPTLLDFDNFGTPALGNSSPIIRLWLVLEELPEDRSGYKIVFSEELGMFGLAVRGNNRDVFIGPYGSFRETFAAM